jgi:ring-1,2-phenylacetyl-CoA epoxidase subunit PaaE
MTVSRPPRFHRLAIGDVRRETADAVSVAWVVPEALRDEYRFVQGQFVVLRATVDGEELRRSYSICIGPLDYARDGELRVAIKRVAGGRFSNWANDTLAPGDAIDVATPDGRFFVPLAPDARRHFVAIAGGSGITPILSLAEATLASEPASRFTLFYGNRDSASIMFLERLEALKNRYMTRFSRVHVLADEAHEIALFHGLLDEARCGALVDALAPAARIDHAFVCGPEPMMAAAEAALRARGLDRTRISIERFGVPAAVAAAAAVAAGPVRDDDARPGADVAFVVDGIERRVHVPFDGRSILDAGLAAGALLPYACKGGVCCTCRARVLDGEVRMDRNYTLEPWEIERGFVLTCQSHPVSARVRLSYDER